MNKNSPADMEPAIKALEQLGVRLLHVFPPRGLICSVPVEVELAVLAQPAVVACYRTPVQLPDETDSLGDVLMAIKMWNRLIAPAPARAALAMTTAEPLVGDAFPHPPAERAKSRQAQAAEAASLGPRFDQTSEYMIGRIAVGIVLPESAGNDENWTPDRQEQVIAGIMAGCNWWVTRSGSSAHLTFYYDLHLSVPTQYEPIQGPYSDEALWIPDTLRNMGYSGSSEFEICWNYENALRSQLHTEWAFTVFVVDSFNDINGKFSDGYFAYAYLNGPFMVMTYDNDGYGIHNMDIVMAHEMGHVFGALDEYAGSSSCTETSGYLNVANGNHASCGSSGDSACIMRGQLGKTSVCLYSRGQIGWRDSDGDGIFDPADTAFSFTLGTSSPGPTYAFAGTAAIVPCPSPTHAVCTINTIVAVEYRVDGGPWLPATPDDSKFDGATEAYRFVVGPLGNAAHTVEARAWDSAGNSSLQAVPLDPPPLTLVFVDWRNTGANPDGSVARPYPTVWQGYNRLDVHGTMRIQAGTYAFPARVLTKALTLEPINGVVRLSISGTATEPATTTTVATLQPPVRRADGTLAMQFQAVPGQHYQILTSTDLKTWAVWKDFTAETEVVELVQTPAANEPYRFFTVTMP